MFRNLSIVFFFTLSLFGEIEQIEVFSTTHKINVSSSSGTLIINWNKPNNSDIYQYRYIINNSSLNSLSEGGKRLNSSYNSLSIPLNDLEDGDYYFHIVAESTNLEISPEKIFGKIRIDRTPPSTYISEIKKDDGSVEIILNSREKSEIYYTLDSSEPTLDSEKYEEPIIVFTDTEIKFLGIDEAENREEVKSRDISVSYRGNIAEFSILNGSEIATNGTNGATNPIPYISIFANDLDSFKYQIDNEEFSEWQDSSEKIYVGDLKDGEHNLKVFGRDSFGNIQATSSELVFFVDNTKPDLIISINGNEVLEDSSFSRSVVLSLSSNENGFIKYTIDGTNPSKISGTTYTKPINISDSSVIKAVAIDTLGNLGDLKNFRITIDRDSPESIDVFADSLELNNSHPNFLDGKFIFANEQSLKFTVSEGSAYWTLDGTTPTIRSQSGNLIIEQSATLNFIGADEVGNTTPVETREIIIDTVSPQITDVQMPDSCGIVEDVWVCSESLLNLYFDVFEEATPDYISFYYTTNGDKPTKESSVLESGTSISLSTAIKKIKVIGFDWIGNESSVFEFDVRYEKLITSPSALFSIYNGEYINSEKEPKITLTIDDGGATPYFYWKFENDSFQTSYVEPYQIDISKLDEDIHHLTVIVSNGEKNSTTYYKEFSIDNTNPVEPTISGENNFSGTTDIVIEAEETPITILYSKNYSNPSSRYLNPITIGETTTIYAQTQDKAGNRSPIVSQKFEKFLEPEEEEPEIIEPEEEESEIIEPEEEPEVEDINETEEPEEDSPPRDLGNLVVYEKSWGEIIEVESSTGIQFETIAIDFNGSNEDVILSNSADGSRSYMLDGTKTTIKTAGDIEVSVGDFDFVSRSSTDENITLLINGFHLTGEDLGFQFFESEWIAGNTFLRTDRLDLTSTLYGNSVILYNSNFTMTNDTIDLEVTRDSDIALITDLYEFVSNEKITKEVAIERNRVFFGIASGRYGVDIDYKTSSLTIETNSSDFKMPNLIINSGDRISIDVENNFGDNLEISVELPLNGTIEF
jgi:hypothetical protein